MDENSAGRGPRSVFFDRENGSADEAIAPSDPDPTGGSRTPALMEHLAGRSTRQSLVSNPDTDGISFTIFTFAPGTVLPRHRHDVDYIEFVLEGEVRYGNKTVGPGGGVYRSAGTPYTLTIGPKGAVVADFRAHTYYRTEYLDAPEDWVPHQDSDVRRA
jgi:hypothetical protein